MKRILITAAISLSIFMTGCSSSSNQKIYTPNDRAMQYSEVFIPVQSSGNQEYHRVMNFGDFQIIQTFKNGQQVYTKGQDHIKKPDDTSALVYAYSPQGYTAAVLYSFNLQKAKQTIGDSSQYFDYVDHQVNKDTQIVDKVVGLNIVKKITEEVINDKNIVKSKSLFKDHSENVKKEVQRRLNLAYPNVFMIQDFKLFH